jgi:hypothetical protein
VTNLIKKLKGIDANKAQGPFDPCLKIIKLFAEYFAVPLVHIFNQSFQTMKLPEVWKISNVCNKHFFKCHCRFFVVSETYTII